MSVNPRAFPGWEGNQRGANLIPQGMPVPNIPQQPQPASSTPLQRYPDRPPGGRPNNYQYTPQVAMENRGGMRPGFQTRQQMRPYQQGMPPPHPGIAQPPRIQTLPSHAQRVSTDPLNRTQIPINVRQGPVPGSLKYNPPLPQQIPPQDIPARIASANAALSAIHSVAPPPPVPIVKNCPKMMLTALPQLPGGDINSTISFPATESTPVVDEVTAQRSALEFSSFLNDVRKSRNRNWDLFWRNRIDLNNRILRSENTTFLEAQEEVSEYESQYEDDNPRNNKTINVPYILDPTGSFDVPLPPPVTIPDPEVVMRQYQQMQAHATQQAQAQAQALRQHQTMSSRQRAAANIKTYNREY